MMDARPFLDAQFTFHHNGDIPLTLLIQIYIPFEALLRVSFLIEGAKALTPNALPETVELNQDQSLSNEELSGDHLVSNKESCSKDHSVISREPSSDQDHERSCSEDHSLAKEYCSKNQSPASKTKKRAAKITKNPITKITPPNEEPWTKDNGEAWSEQNEESCREYNEELYIEYHEDCSEYKDERNSESNFSLKVPRRYKQRLVIQIESCEITRLREQYKLTVSYNVPSGLMTHRGPVYNVASCRDDVPRTIEDWQRQGIKCKNRDDQTLLEGDSTKTQKLQKEKTSAFEEACAPSQSSKRRACRRKGATF